MQLKFENHHPRVLLVGGGERHPLHWPRLTSPLWPPFLQKLDPFLADLRQASSLLKASIREFEKGDPPGGVQVRQEPEVGKPHHIPYFMDQGLSEGALFSFIHSTDIYWAVTMCHGLETQPGANRLVPALVGLMVQCERS